MKRATGRSRDGGDIAARRPPGTRARSIVGQDGRPLTREVGLATAARPAHDAVRSQPSGSGLAMASGTSFSVSYIFIKPILTPSS